MFVDKIPGVSVIISTYNGKDKIIHTLHALENQKYVDFETIVIIDGSQDDTAAYLRSHEFNLQRLEIVEQENRGRAGVRNKGAELATGQILIFYDDDMTPEVDSVFRHYNFHKKHVYSICCGNQMENALEALNDFDRFRCHLRRKWLEKYVDEITPIHRNNLFLTAANFSVPGKIFRDLHGFNMELRDAEDMELAFRALQQGINIYFDKNNIAWHRDFVSCRKYIQRRREYYTEFRKINAIMPQFLPVKEKLIKLNAFKYLVFSILSQRLLVRWIDSEVLRFLPRNIRHKIYDLVITGLGSVFIHRKV